jgi:hypothetical protein
VKESFSLLLEEHKMLGGLNSEAIKPKMHLSIGPKIMIDRHSTAYQKEIFDEEDDLPPYEPGVALSESLIMQVEEEDMPA